MWLWSANGEARDKPGPVWDRRKDRQGGIVQWVALIFMALTLLRRWRFCILLLVGGQLPSSTPIMARHWPNVSGKMASIMAYTDVSPGRYQIQSSCYDCLQMNSSVTAYRLIHWHPATLISCPISFSEDSPLTLFISGIHQLSSTTLYIPPCLSHQNPATLTGNSAIFYPIASITASNKICGIRFCRKFIIGNTPVDS